jgi:hypothetical protein
MTRYDALAAGISPLVAAVPTIGAPSAVPWPVLVVLGLAGPVTYLVRWWMLCRLGRLAVVLTDPATVAATLATLTGTGPPPPTPTEVTPEANGSSA